MKIYLSILFLFVAIISKSQDSYYCDSILSKTGNIYTCHIDGIDFEYIYYFSENRKDLVHFDLVEMYKYQNVWRVRNDSTFDVLSQIQMDSARKANPFYTKIYLDYSLKRINKNDSLLRLYERINRCGIELKKSSNHYYAGLGLMVLGSFLLIALNEQSDQNKKIKTGLLIGGVVSNVIGLGFSLEYMQHVGQAGNHLLL